MHRHPTSPATGEPASPATEPVQPGPVQLRPRSGTPGRSRGTCTRSDSGRIVQRNGVGISTDSPSIHPNRDPRLIGVDDDLTGGEHPGASASAAPMAPVVVREKQVAMTKAAGLRVTGPLATDPRGLRERLAALRGS